MITYGVKEEKSLALLDKVNAHKIRFIKLFYGRYLELLPSLITYENTDDNSIDFLQLENGLRNNYDMVIGEMTNNKIAIMGHVTKQGLNENTDFFASHGTISKKDINFLIPKKLIPEEMKEISLLDNAETGNFVVIRNKTLNYINDLEVLEHYTHELAEIVLSRFSIAMQTKINTFFTGEINDETINQLVTMLYQGAPFVKMSGLFDPKDNIHHLENESLASNFAELKREYQNKISELNNMLGINSLAVEKTSGVSDAEAKSNRSYTTSNANIYLESRNRPFKALNKRFSLSIEAIYNDEVASEFANVAYDKEVNT